MNQWDVLEEPVRPVYLVGLSELFRGLLERTGNSRLAGEAFGLCWDWLEGREVAEKRFDELCHDEYDHGANVEAELARDPQVRSAWYCLTLALAATGYFAYRAKGRVQMPEPLKMVPYEDVTGDFIRRLADITPRSRVISDGFLEYLKQRGSRRPTREEVIGEISRLAAD